MTGTRKKLVFNVGFQYSPEVSLNRCSVLRFRDSLFKDAQQIIRISLNCEALCSPCSGFFAHAVYLRAIVIKEADLVREITCIADFIKKPIQPRPDQFSASVDSCAHNWFPHLHRLNDYSG